jgi:hypothetical protein
MRDLDNIDTWSALLRVLTYGIIMVHDPMNHVDTAIASAIDLRTHYGSPEDFLHAIRNALAYKGDLAELLFQEHSDAVVRAFLAAVQRRLLERAE